MFFIPTVIPDCGEVSSEGSGSDTISPTPPPPKRRKPPAKQAPATGKAGRGKHRYRHRGRKGKRKSKGKKKYVTSSSTASSPSHDSTDSESPDTHQVTSKKVKLSKKAVTKPSMSPAHNPEDKVDKQHALSAIFQRYYDSLVTTTGTCGVDTIANKLYSKNLISENVLGQVITGQDSDSIKASKVLYNVKERIKVDPGKLRTLVEVLKKEPVFDDLTKEITSEYNCKS